MANDFLPGNNNEAPELFLNIKFLSSKQKQKLQFGCSKMELDLQSIESVQLHVLSSTHVA